MRFFICLAFATLIFSCKNQSKQSPDFPIEPRLLQLGSDGLDVANYIIKTKDNGYMVAGYFSNEDQDGYYGGLIKLNSNIDTVWTRRFGQQGDNRAWSVAETPEGDYLVTGFSDEPGGNGKTDVLLYKVDEAGRLLWSKKMGGAEDDLAWEIIATRDGHYVIAAQTQSKGAGNHDAWLIKIDEDGDLIWDKTYGSAGLERIFAITEDHEGRLYATGIYTMGQRDDPIDIYTIAVDSEHGELLWEDRLDKGGNDTGHGITTAQNGEVWVTGYTTSTPAGDQDGFITQYSNGESTDFMTMGTPYDDRVMNIFTDESSNFWLVGYSSDQSQGEYYNFWLARTDTQGKLTWSHNEGGPNFDRAVHMLMEQHAVIAVGTQATTENPHDPQLTVLRLPVAK